MYTLDYIRSIILVNEDGVNYIPVKLDRTDEGNRIYDEFKEKCLAEYGSMANHVMKNLLDDFKQPIVFIDNTFPYDLESHVKHMVIWSKEMLDNDKIANFLRQRSELKGKEYIWFQNAPFAKSIPEVNHYHVLIY